MRVCRTVHVEEEQMTNDEQTNAQSEAMNLKQCLETRLQIKSPLPGPQGPTGSQKRQTEILCEGNYL